VTQAFYYLIEMIKKTAFLFFVLILNACNVKKVDTTAMKEQMENHKIKKVSQSDIVNYVEEISQKALLDFKKQINDTQTCNVVLQNQIYNKLEMIDIDDPLKKSGQKKINEILEAYQYGIKNKQRLGTNIQNINDTLFLFTFKVDPLSKYYIKCKKDIGMMYFLKKDVVNSLTKTLKKAK
jgi:hypothetical protein